MIKLERPVYEKIWTGGIDQILSYDDGKFTVKDCRTGKERTHMTALDCTKLSFSTNDFSKVDYDCVKYVIESGIQRLDRIPKQFHELINNTSETMQNLIEILHKVNNGEVEVETCTFDGDDETYIKVDHDTENIGAKIVNLADEALIFNGQCNFDNIRKLAQEGFPVFAGEQDSFGWLTGCIRTNKGTVVYG